MVNPFNRTSITQLNKLIKSRLNKDGFALIDTIVAFVILTMLITLLLGFMSTTVRTAPVVESEAEDHQASMIAMTQAVARTSSVQELEFTLTSYVPSRSLREPNKMKLFNNYNVNDNKMINPDGDRYELLSKNLIPSSSMSIYVHPTSNQWVQRVTTPKLKGATFTFEPVSNLLTDNEIPTNPSFSILYREEKQKSRLKPIDTLNYPKSYIESEMMIYENTVR